jgi:hypothetical protein
MATPSQPVHDLELLRLFRLEQANFEKHLELKENEILFLRKSLGKSTEQGTQTDQVLEKLMVDRLRKEDTQLQIINNILSVGSDSIPFFQSVKQFKNWIFTLQNGTSNRENVSSASDHVETQTDDALAFSLLSLFAKDLKRKVQKSKHNQNITDLNAKYQSTLKQLEYQIKVNAEIKKLIVESVVGNQINNNSIWGSDPDIQKNILELYNDALVKMGELNQKIDVLESQNVQLNQILEEFLMATID